MDLGGFITPQEYDFASGGNYDFAVAPAADMAQPASSPDMAQASASCGSITYAGTCTGTTLKYCSMSSQLTTIDCAPSGRQCTVVSGDADCRYVAGSACGSVDSGGVCDGNDVVYCNSSNQITIQQCTGGTSCLKLFGYADCI